MRSSFEAALFGFSSVTFELWTLHLSSCNNFFWCLIQTISHILSHTTYLRYVQRRINHCTIHFLEEINIVVSVHSPNNCNHYFFHLNCASVHLINTIFHRLPSRHQVRTDHMWLYYRIFGILKQLGLRGAILLVKIEIAGNPWSTLLN